MGEKIQDNLFFCSYDYSPPIVEGSGKEVSGSTVFYFAPGAEFVYG